MLPEIEIFLFQLHVKAGAVLLIGFALVLLLKRYQAELRLKVLRQLGIVLLILPLLLVTASIINFGYDVDLDFKSYTPYSSAPKTLEPQDWRSGPVDLNAQPAALAANEISSTGAENNGELINVFSVNWLLFATSIYLTGVVLLIGQLLFQYLCIGRRIQQLEGCDNASAIELKNTLCEVLRLKQNVKLVYNNLRQTPYIWGLRQVNIVLPYEFQQWPSAMQRSALLHELIHIQKADLLGGLLAKLCCCIYWPNPLVWLFRRISNLEMEQACDEQVIAQTSTAESYADQLIGIAKHLSQSSSLIDTLLPTMARSSTLKHRIDNILNKSRRRVMNKSFKITGNIFLLGLTLFVVILNAQSQGQSDTTIYESEQRPTYIALSRVEPVYPTRAASTGREGFVVIEFDIAKTGRVMQPTIIESEPEGLFDKSALEAIDQWLYLPANIDGKAIESHGVRTKLTFRLGTSTKIEALGSDERYQSLQQGGPQSAEEGLMLVRHYIATANLDKATQVAIDCLENENFNSFNALSNFIKEIPFYRLNDEIMQQGLERLEAKAEQSQQGDRFALLAQLYQKTKNWPAAQLALSKAFAAGSLSEPTSVKLTLAKVLFNTQRYEAAIKVLNDLIASDSESEEIKTWHQIVDSERYRQSLITDHLLKSAAR